MLIFTLINGLYLRVSNEYRCLHLRFITASEEHPDCVLAVPIFKNLTPRGGGGSERPHTPSSKKCKPSEGLHPQKCRSVCILTILCRRRCSTTQIFTWIRPCPQTPQLQRLATSCRVRPHLNI